VTVGDNDVVTARPSAPRGPIPAEASAFAREKAVALSGGPPTRQVPPIQPIGNAQLLVPVKRTSDTERGVSDKTQRYSSYSMELIRSDQTALRSPRGRHFEALATSARRHSMSQPAQPAVSSPVLRLRSRESKSELLLQTISDDVVDIPLDLPRYRLQETMKRDSVEPPSPLEQGHVPGLAEPSALGSTYIGGLALVA